jgi:hypothetical protein
MFLYAYIRSMVKDRTRVLNRANFPRDLARRDIARGYGAGEPLAIRYRAASGSIRV